MAYQVQLPPLRQLLSLAQQTLFPATRAELVRLARSMGSPKAVTDFLKLFPADETFISRSDFMIRCEEIEILIGQARMSPAERLRSPQD